MKILVLNYEFPPVGGGGGAAAERICAWLTAQGHEVRVETSLVRGLPQVETRDGYTIHRRFAGRRRADRCSVWEMALYLMTTFWPTWRHTRAWRPDVIHVHFAVPTGVLAWLIHKLTGIPYLLTVHLGDVPGALPQQTDRLFRVLKPLTIPIWKRAAAITAVSDFVRGLAEKAYGTEVKTVYNAIDLPSASTPKQFSEGPVRLLFAGRFNPQKNLLFLINVLEELVDLEWTLDLAGNGPQEKALRSAVTEAGLDSRVTFHGWVEPREVNALMESCHILCMPSLSEGLPVVAVQALAHGMVIVGSEIGGLRDVVRGDNGFLIPLNDLSGFRACLRTLISDQALLARLGENSKKLAEDFDLDKVGRAYEALLEVIQVKNG